jgi:hypothetical protein
VSISSASRGNEVRQAIVVARIADERGEQGIQAQRLLEVVIEQPVKRGISIVATRLNVREREHRAARQCHCAQPDNDTNACGADTHRAHRELLVECRERPLADMEVVRNRDVKNSDGCRLTQCVVGS